MRGIKIKDGILFCRGKEVFRKDPAFILIPPTKLLSSKIDRIIYINLDIERSIGVTTYSYVGKTTYCHF